VVDTWTIAQLALSAFSNETSRVVAEKVIQSLYRFTPIIREKNNQVSLEPPGNRLGIGMKLLDGRQVLAIYLEKGEGSAYNEALALQEKEPEKVVVEVVGFAQVGTPQSITKISSQPGLRPGASVGHIHSWAGTLGAFVQFKYKDKKALFKGFTSAAHVLGCNNKAEKGEHVISPGRPDIVQPTPDDKIGKLAKFAYLTHYSEQNDPNAIINKADIAIVELDDETICPTKNLVPNPSDPRTTIPIKGVLKYDDLIAHLNQPVYMVGRSSGFSEGILDGVSIAAFPIKLPDARKYLYGELNVVKPRSEDRRFSEAGDSGALVYTADGMAAGFLVAGSPSRSFFHPAYLCLENMGANLIL
jgi:hypothetical protein